MRTCVDLLSPPYQSRQGRLMDYIGSVVLDSGAIALLSFAQNSYVIGGRVFENPALAITTVEQDYINGTNGAITTGRYVADFLPGIYDLVQIDPFGGEVIQNVVVSRGHEITARAQAFYLQIILAFPAGEKTLAELEALIVPLNVKADWGETDSNAASFIKNKPAFITEDDLNTLLATTIGDTIETEVETQLTPAIAAAQQAATDAQNALDALGDVRTYHTLGATYPIGAVVWSNVNDLSYRSLTAHDNVQLDPANDPTNWERIGATAAQGVKADTALQSLADIDALVTHDEWRVKPEWKVLDFVEIDSAVSEIDLTGIAAQTRLKLVIEDLRSDTTVNRTCEILLLYGASPTESAANSTAEHRFAVRSDRTDYTASGEYVIYNFGVTTAPIIDGRNVYRTSDTTVTVRTESDFYPNNFPHNGIRIKPNSGNIASGRVWLLAAVE